MNVPEIRFKEFDEVWSENLLEDFFTKVTSKNRKLKYSVVLTNSAEYGIIGQLDYFDFDVTNSNNIGGYFIVEPDDFVYNPRVSVSAPVGPINRNRLGYTGIMSPLYLVFKINGINKDFLCYYYKTKKWHRFMKLSGNCGARFDRLSISDDKFVKMPIIHPNNTKEQNQICKVFENLDDLIEESTLRLVSLNRIKAASLQSMFPQEGETVPKVRFKGFEEEWICVLFKEIAYKTGIKNSENLLLESYSISNELGFIPQNEQFENGGTMSKADKRMYYIVSPKSFAYNPARINVGSLGYYQGERDVIVSSLYEVFKTSNIVDDLFLLYWFKTNMFKRMIEQYQEGGVRLYFFFDKLQKCQIKVPSLQEQQKIASYFCNLDKQISLQTQHLEKLKQIKAACLDKMFV